MILWTYFIKSNKIKDFLNVTSLIAMKWKNDQNWLQYVEECKSKYLQNNCKNKYPLGMIGLFFASQDKFIRRKVWERERLDASRYFKWEETFWKIFW